MVSYFKHALVVLTACIAIAPETSAYIIHNQTNSAAICAIYQADSPTPLNVFIVGGGQTLDCPVGFPCNPVGQFDYRYTLRVTTSQTHGNFEANIPLEVGGTVYIRSAARNWTPQPDLHLQSFDTSGVFIEETYPNFGQYSGATRNVQFLGTSDCQYFHHHCCNAQGQENTDHQPFPAACGTLGYNLQCPHAQNVYTNSNRTHARLREEFSFNPFLRGAIIAGDMTQTAKSEEWEWYLESFTEQGTKYTLLPYIFEGLGNHDYGPQHNNMIEHIRDHSRNTVRTFRGPDPLPHYSWDWHDVHFVQLNLMPANIPSHVNPDMDPYAALSFLVDDLAQHVGTSGRPVVLIHHFGFDTNISLNSGNEWWFPYQMDAYWIAISSYNVKLIITGHWHAGLGSGTDTRLIKWNRPAGIPLAIGPDSINTFNTASSLANVICELQMGPNSAVEVYVKDSEDGSIVSQNRCVGFDKNVYCAPGATGSGDGGTRYPYTSIQHGVDSVMTYKNECVDAITSIKITAGTYQEQVTTSISRKVRLDAVGGLVRIGQP